MDLMVKHYEAIVLGTSAGGFKALSAIVPELPAHYSLPVIVVQHMREDSDGLMTQHLNSLSGEFLNSALRLRAHRRR